MDPFLAGNRQLCAEIVQLWKAGEVDEAMDLLFKKRSDPDLSLSDHVSINLLLADMGDIERHDCKKFAGDALYLCEEMRRLHDRLYANTSLPQIDISIFEDLEGCAQFSLDEIEEKEEAVIAQGKTVFRESMIQEQAFKSEAHLQHHKPAQIEGSVDAIIKVEDGDMEMSESAEGASRKRRCQ